MNRHIIILLLTLLTLAGTACRSTKNSAGGTDTGRSQGTNVTATVTADSPRQWRDVYMPVKVSLKSPMSMSLSGRATMVRDSLINISLRFMGFVEVAEINITADSVVMLDKHNDYMFAEPLQAVMGSHNITVGQMQDIILGCAVPGSVPGADRSENQLAFGNPGSDKPLTVTYSDFADTPAGQLAQLITVQAPVKSTDVTATIDWNLKSAKWNSGRKTRFITPSKGYKRITMSNAMRMLKSMQ